MFNKIAHLEDRVAYVISRVIKQIGNRRELSRHSIKITHFAFIQVQNNIRTLQDCQT